jgi:hypothetical protein
MSIPEKEQIALSDSLLAACKAAGIESPRYVAQDSNRIVYHYGLEPAKSRDFRVWRGNQNDDGYVEIDHPSYADDWKDSLLEWVEQGEHPAIACTKHADHIVETNYTTHRKVVVLQQRLFTSRFGDPLDCTLASDRQVIDALVIAERAVNLAIKSGADYVELRYINIPDIVYSSGKNLVGVRVTGSRSIEETTNNIIEES